MKHRLRIKSEPDMVNVLARAVTTNHTERLGAVASPRIIELDYNHAEL